MFSDLDYDEKRLVEIEKIRKNAKEFYYQNITILSEYAQMCEKFPADFQITPFAEISSMPYWDVADGIYYDVYTKMPFNEEMTSQIIDFENLTSLKLNQFIEERKNIIDMATNDSNSCGFHFVAFYALSEFDCWITYVKNDDYIFDRVELIEGDWYITIYDGERYKPIGSDRFFEDRVYRATKEYYDQNKEWLQDILEEGKQINSSFIYYPKSNEYIYEQVEKDIPNEEMIKIKDLARKVDTYLGEGYGQSTELTISYFKMNKTGVNIYFQLEKNKRSVYITLIGWKNWFIAKSQELLAELTGKDLYVHTIEGLWSVVFEIIDYV